MIIRIALRACYIQIEQRVIVYVVGVDIDMNLTNIWE